MSASSRLPYAADAAAVALPNRWNALALYNAEVSRGIVHTPAYVERMAADQRAFNDAQRAALDARGGRWVTDDEGREIGWIGPPEGGGILARLKARLRA